MLFYGPAAEVAMLRDRDGSGILQSAAAQIKRTARLFAIKNTYHICVFQGRVSTLAKIDLY
jgi:hypothetical protein